MTVCRSASWKIPPDCYGKPASHQGKRVCLVTLTAPWEPLISEQVSASSIYTLGGERAFRLGSGRAAELVTWLSPAGDTWAARGTSASPEGSAWSSCGSAPPREAASRQSASPPPFPRGGSGATRTHRPAPPGSAEAQARGGVGGVAELRPPPRPRPLPLAPAEGGGRSGAGPGDRRSRGRIALAAAPAEPPKFSLPGEGGPRPAASGRSGPAGARGNGAGGSRQARPR